MAREFESQGNLLKKWLESRGIALVLWDCDGTILDTAPEFYTRMNRFVDYLNSRLPQYSRESLYELLEKFDDEAYKTLSVSPQRWAKVAQDMAGVLAVEENLLTDGLPILMEIYLTVPQFYEGAKDALTTFRETGLPMGLVTHSTQVWAQDKIDQRGLIEFFDKVFIVKETEFKGPEHWLEAINAFNARPESTMIIGDNLAGDIRAAHSLGVKTKVYFPGKWVVYNSGEIPEGTLVVERGVKDLINLLVSMT